MTSMPCCKRCGIEFRTRNQYETIGQPGAVQYVCASRKSCQRRINADKALLKWILSDSGTTAVLDWMASTIGSENE